MKVNDIFYSIQGEGGRSGEASIFIRLSDCNRNCWFCDTDWEKGKEMTLPEILKQIKPYKSRWIVWTGGEPTLQLTNEAVKLTENIRRNGQVENIIIRQLGDKFEVVNGNHRLDSFRELKIKEVMCYNFGEITQEQAMRIAIETNETRFKSNTIKLAETIKQLTEQFNMDDLSTTMPYSVTEIEEMSALLDFDWEQFENTEDLTETTEIVLSVKLHIKVKERLDQLEKTYEMDRHHLITKWIKGEKI